MNGRPWTQAETKLLADLWRNGVPTPDIAAQVGRSERAVGLKAAQVNARRPRWFLTLIRGNATAEYRGVA